MIYPGGGKSGSVSSEYFLKTMTCLPSSSSRVNLALLEFWVISSRLIQGFKKIGALGKPPKKVARL